MTSSFIIYQKNIRKIGFAFVFQNLKKSYKLLLPGYKLFRGLTWPKTLLLFYVIVNQIAKIKESKMVAKITSFDSCHCSSNYCIFAAVEMYLFKTFSCSMTK